MRTICLFIVLLVINNCKAQSFQLLNSNPKAGQVYTTYNLHFSLGKDSLLMDEDKTTLDSIQNFLNFNKSLKVEIGVHTDFRGSDSYNLSMSQARADKLKAYFVKKGTETGRLISKGYGETKPLRSEEEQNKLDPDRHEESLNRRVTLTILK